MNDLTAFYADRLTELEAIANEAASRPLGAAWDDGTRLTAVARHIRANDPAAVLADITADREVLTAYDDAKSWLDEREDPESDYSWAPELRTAELIRQRVIVETLLTVIKIRAGRFASHPGYRAGWAP